jgi:alkylation response protein AidB-like acyl-CoA dehydrogenase
MMRDTANGAAVLATARDYHARIIARREAIETSRRLPEDLARELAHAGFFAFFCQRSMAALT